MALPPAAPVLDAADAAPLLAGCTNDFMNSGGHDPRPVNLDVVAARDNDVPGVRH